MNAVVQIQPSRLPISPSIAKEFDLGPSEWRVLVDQIFPAAKSVEAVMMALAYCRKRNLDIFKKPVHIVPMWSSAKRQMVETVWPGIAEIRTTATRTGQYAGIDAVEFGPMVERTFAGKIKQGDNWEEVKKTVRFPEWASVVVHRIVAGESRAYHAKVYWEETYASIGKTDIPNDMWGKRPRGQLDKCVEAAALRKAFPEELGNTYAAEEMEGRTIDGLVVDHAAAAPRPAPPKPPAPPTVLARAPAADPDTGEIIDDAQIVRETGESVDAVMDDWPEDADEFLLKLKEAMGAAPNLDVVEAIWEESDALARLAHNETQQAIAVSIQKTAFNRLGGRRG